MLDVISVLLGIVSIAQNTINQHDKTIKTKKVHEVLCELDKFFIVLDEAKKIHDDFENFSFTAMEPLYKLSRQGFTSEADAFSNVETFKWNSNRFLSDTDNFLPNININIDDSNLEKLPANLQKNTRILTSRIPIVQDRLREFRAEEQNIISCSNSQNYGIQFKGAIQMANDKSKAITESADKIILNSVPIIGYIHQRIKDMIDS